MDTKLQKANIANSFNLENTYFLKVFFPKL
jgi:hypothetical protein